MRERIERAHETAIDRALTYATRQVAMLWSSKQARSCTPNVLLHAAVRRDGRIVAIDSRSWLVHDAGASAPTP
ncbi:MAG: hypothetical protein JOZ07_18700 [Solirubrobacterales bacterium]|nr:hypothetical protein [Solirubrobacterales bacterium]